LSIESNKRGGKVLGIPLVALRALFNALYGLSGILFVLSYLYRNNQYYYLTDPYIGWAILCLFLGFFINLVYATK
jgi:hypothetical protein